MKVVMLLLLAGLCSMVERLLLACFHLRQSPYTVLGFGIVTFALDGIKLFGKGGSSVVRTGAMIPVLAMTLLLGVIMDDVSNLLSNSLSTGVIHVWLLLGLLATLEVLDLCVVFISGNKFASLAIVRMAGLAVLGELTWGIFIVNAGWMDSVGNPEKWTLVTSELNLLNVCEYLFVGSLVLMVTGRAPVDVVEAESELIDGATVDLSGAAFSVIYAGEVALFLLTVKFMLSITLLRFLVCWIQLAIAVLTMFIGRLFLARLMMKELTNWVLGSGLIGVVVLCLGA